MNSCLISKKISIHSKNNIDCSSIPELNHESIGKKVEEVSVEKSLNIINAEWDGEYQYGKKLRI